MNALTTQVSCTLADEKFVRELLQIFYESQVMPSSSHVIVHALLSCIERYAALLTQPHLRLMTYSWMEFTIIALPSLD